MANSDAIEKPVNNKKARKRRKRLFWIIGVVLLLIIIFSIIMSGKKEKLIEVQTEKIGKRNITQIVTGTGKIQAEKKVDISAEVSGEIILLPFEEGDEVRKGQLVVRIRPDAYYPQMRQQEAGIRVQESNLKAQEVNLRKNDLELNRIKELFSKGLASQSELDNAQANYDATLASMNTIRAQINQQRAGLSAVQYDLSKTTIAAPMSGTVTQLNNEVGEKVLGTMSNMGSNILTISDLSSMEAQVEIGETDVTNVKIGDTARIQIDAFPDKIFNGVVYEIANTATSKGTGTQEEVVNFIVKIRIDKEDYELRPGMSCTVDIEVKYKENVLAVPIQCVTTRDEDTTEIKKIPEGEQQVIDTKTESRGIKKNKPKEIIFVVENGVAKKKVVKTGISDATYIEIIEGVNEGEEVVKGSFKAINKELDDNSKVKVNDEKTKKQKSEDEE
ncbi:MAG: efflux RND transporter periplasmic adaptor subunit [Ignavibacteria bacterium]|nr:efflux RND transporter periplasmic adaptor subunit [Ignavibacteria bacterium]